jgi:hypothetical protein
MPTTFRQTASFGKRQEYSAIARMLREGLDVYMTLVDDRGIDCVVRKGPTAYLDIQIKARSKEVPARNAARFSAMDVDNPRPNYFFVFYSEALNKYWVVPSLDVVKLAYRNKSGKNAGRYSLSLTGLRSGKPYPKSEFAQFEEAFYLLA